MRCGGYLEHVVGKFCYLIGSTWGVSCAVQEDVDIMDQIQHGAKVCNYVIQGDTNKCVLFYCV
jgi:hypothetical protein